MAATLYFDGGFYSRTKVGTYGWVLEGNILMKESGYVDDCPDNVTAEYTALILGLKKAISNGVSVLTIKGDSKTVLHQITGQIKTRKTHRLHREALHLLSLMPEYTLEWIPRSQNPADSLT